MAQEEPQSKQGRPPPQLVPWAVAVLSASLLSAGFIASCLVTHRRFLRCERTRAGFRLPEQPAQLTCTREDAGPGGSEAGQRGAWGCCPAGWRAFRSSCYLPLNDNRTWADSEGHCAQTGAHLASVGTADEQNFITQLLDRRFSYFLGLTDANLNGQWRWVDRTAFDPGAAFWQEGEPARDAGKDCAVLVNGRDRWAWRAVSCRSKTGGICEAPRAALG